MVGVSSDCPTYNTRAHRNWDKVVALQMISIHRCISDPKTGLRKPIRLTLCQDNQRKEQSLISIRAIYVTVDPKAGRALFYYFVESPQDSSSKPLVLWLNGGPGCSSFGFGAMEELGPFRVNNDKISLFANDYAWNNVANVLFLESPAGVGFSYSNTSSDYGNVGDKRTAEDSYAFLVNWLERFPEYKNRDFFITGESYAGHYVPQLAYTIVQQNKITNQTKINLKGIAIGNAWIDYNTSAWGIVDYLWTHALSSDETNAGIHKYCDFTSENSSDLCDNYVHQLYKEKGHIDMYNIYSPLCLEDGSKTTPGSVGSVFEFDPCSDEYVEAYLNLAEVQAALHVKPTQWTACGYALNASQQISTITLHDRPPRLIEYKLNANGKPKPAAETPMLDRVPVTASRYSINTLSLPVETPWRPWNSNPDEVGGYVVGYKGLTFATVRGAGHQVPSYQPQRSLVFISSFLHGTLPPAPPSS
ncbi:hypothetical protein ACLB2K_014948 [Fragaria x ananassa]